MSWAPIRIMYFSPVAPGIEDIYADTAGRIKLPGTEVHVTSMPRSAGNFSNLEYRAYEAMATRGILRAVRAAAREGFDAFVIGCFYDTALNDAREISGEMVVVAPCGSACEIAVSLANRFGVIVGRRKWVNQMDATVREYGHAHRLTGFYPVDLEVTDFQKDQAETARRLIAAGRKAVEEDFAEAIVLGCTREAGFHQRVENELGVPVIDPSSAALKRAEYAAILKRQCGWKPSRKWSCEAPQEHEIERIGGFDEGEAFGSRIVVAAS